MVRMSLSELAPRAALTEMDAHLNLHLGQNQWRFVGPDDNKEIREHAIICNGDARTAALSVEKNMAAQKLNAGNWERHFVQHGVNTIQVYINRDKHLATRKLAFICTEIKRSVQDLSPDTRLYHNIFNTTTASIQVLGSMNLVRVRVDPTSKDVILDWDKDGVEIAKN